MENDPSAEYGTNANGSMSTTGNGVGLSTVTYSTNLFVAIGISAFSSIFGMGIIQNNIRIE